MEVIRARDYQPFYIYIPAVSNRIVLMKLIDLAGKRFSRWTVLYRAQDKIGSKGEKCHQWMCKCDCGEERIVSGPNLRKGLTKSCGCLHSENLRRRLTTHGMSYSPEFQIWLGMIQRCSNPNSDQFKDYGGRGIFVCDRWKQFENFIADMGKRPRGMSIDRRDNDKGYFPENCRWTTRKIQNRNARSNRLVTYNGETKPIAAWAEEIGMNYFTLRARLLVYKWPIERALLTHV